MIVCGKAGIFVGKFYEPCTMLRRVMIHLKLYRDKMLHFSPKNANLSQFMFAIGFEERKCTYQGMTLHS